MGFERARKIKGESQENSLQNLETTWKVMGKYQESSGKVLSNIKNVATNRKAPEYNRDSTERAQGNNLESITKSLCEILVTPL